MAGVAVTSKNISGFDPRSVVPGCVLWLDGADSSSLTFSSGSNVSTWSDKSGNGNNATALSGTPALTSNAINSVSAISMNAGYFTGGFSSTLNGTGMTSFMVGTMNSASGGYPRYLSLGRPGVNDYNSSDTIAAFLRLNGLNINIQSADISANVNLPAYDTPFISTSSRNNTLISINVNGGTSATNTTSVGALNVTSYAVGVNTNTSDYFALYGYIGEIIVFNTSLTTSQIQQVEGYLAWKWVITSSLPTTHPYYPMRPFSRVFQPTDVGNCILWLDAADNSTITLSGSTVTNWKDKSGYGGYTNTGSPTYSATQLNGLPAITTATATPTYITGSFGAGLASTQYYTLFFVFNYTNYSGNNSRLFGMAATGANDFSGSGFNASLSGVSGPGVSPISFLFQNCSGTITPNSYASTTGPTIVSITISGNTIIPNTFGIGTPSFGPAGSTIGADWAEALIFNTSLTTSQIQKIQGYLAWKWGLNGQIKSFSPTQISGCVGWFDGADTSSASMTFSSGSNISVWKDKSTTANNLSTIQGTPVYTNGGVYIPSAAVLRSVSAYGFTSNATTLFIVAQETAQSGQGLNMLFALSSGNGGNGDYAIRLDNSYLLPNPGNGNDLGYSGGSSTYIINGTPIATSNPSFNTASRILYTPVNQTVTSQFTLSSGFISRYFIGYVFEVIIYSSLLSTTNRQQVESYLSKKWNISISNYLPVNHPYRTLPPSTVVNDTSFITTTGSPTIIYGVSYDVYIFTGSGTLVTNKSITADTLIVGGGGSGGSSNGPTSCGAGGGAGGVIYTTSQAITAGAYNVVVGSGGIFSDLTGGNSSFGVNVATGGGRGGGNGSYSSPGSGGSGGGGYNGGSGGTGTSGQGYAGGGSGSTGGGGGGGAGAVGGYGVDYGNPGYGGVGISSSITGTAKMYGGGGTSGSYYTSSLPGGAGGGGNGCYGNGGGGGSTSATSGSPNTGGGGGGGNAGLSGASGGSGVVIVRVYKIR
jgi:hypothetical protein